LQKQAVLSRRNKAEAPKEEQGGAYGDEARGPHPGADHSGLGEPEPPQAAAAAPVPGGHFGDGASKASIAAAWHERRELRCGGGSGKGWEVDASLAVDASGISGGARGRGATPMGAYSCPQKEASRRKQKMRALATAPGEGRVRRRA